MQLRAGDSGPVVQGTNVGDILVWQGPELGWVAGAGGLPNVVVDQNVTGYFQIAGEAQKTIATASITVKANSRIRVDAWTGVQGSVAAGRVFIFCSLLGVAWLGSESFDAAAGLNFRTPAFCGVSEPQAAGIVTVNLFIEINGAAGARVDNLSENVLILTELLG